MQTSKSIPHSSSLAQVVCEWQPSTLPELAKAFSDSCPSPEITFSSYDSYKAYFQPLLLAEVAAELLSATEKYQRAKPARHAKVRARREEPGTVTALVAVQKVSRHHSFGFGWSVDLDSHDRKGPVGAVDNDVVAVWPCNSSHTQSREGSARTFSSPPTQGIPTSAVCGVVLRTLGRNGCRLVLSKFPDGNEHGHRTDLEEGEENEDKLQPLRLWNLLRLGPLTTMKREFEALQSIKTSVLLPTLLRPKSATANTSAREVQEPGALSDVAGKEQNAPKSADGSQRPRFWNEETYTNVVSSKTGLNASQARAICHASTCRSGFAVIQGPPGTGKTRTLISLLNVIHLSQYQQYYESLLEEFKPTWDSKNSHREVCVTAPEPGAGSISFASKSGQGSLLEGMMVAMNKTLSTATIDQRYTNISKRVRRPRLLVCAPSNSAVDEILTRLIRCKFVDGQGREYSPELARIGAGDKVSEAAKPFTAEGQAEIFLARLCAEDMTPEAQKKAQVNFMTNWQARCNSYLVQLERFPKWKPSCHPAIVAVHEKLERAERDLRRFVIAAAEGGNVRSREEKLRQIGRTYIEDAQLVFATLSGSASNILAKGSQDSTGVDGALFDTVVIDEGAQATEPSCLIPMALGATRCLLVGDPQQLPATVLASGSAGLAYGQSLLERVCRAGQNVQLLDTQYRMHPAISSFPRRYFYNGRLVDDESVQGDNRAKPFHRDVICPKLGPYVFLDISEGQEQRSNNDRSIFNRAEAELAALIYTKLKKEYNSDSLFDPAAKLPGSVSGFGVVTPYKRQMQELRQSFDRAGVPTGDVEIDTVDSFQGREKDVVVFSCVRTAAEHRGIGFVRDVRRMNVGLTRARTSLIILGSARALAEGSADWAELVEDAASRGCLIHVGHVGRCLNPPPPAGSLSASNSNDPVSQQKDRRNMGMSRVMSTHPPPVERKPHSSGRVDPRLRATKKEPIAGPLVSPPLILPAGREREEPKPASLLNPAVPHLTGKHDSHSLPTSTSCFGTMKHEERCVPNTESLEKELAADEKAVALQITLEQMTKVLIDAGFQNPKRAEHVLREHVENGGALDLETVMAAVIASSNAPTTTKEGGISTPNTGQVRAEYPLMPDLPIQNSSTGKPLMRPVPFENAEETAFKMASNASRVNEKGKISSLERSVKIKAAGLRDRDRTFKANGKDKASVVKRDKVQMREPSGWDMLFAKKSETVSANSTEISNPEEGKKQGQLILKTQAEEPSNRIEKLPAKDRRHNLVGPGPTSEEEVRKDYLYPSTDVPAPSSDQKISLAHETDVVQPNIDKARKGWNEKGREFDRKRPRGHDLATGRGVGRGDRGRNHTKRGRGRGLFQERGAPNRYNPSEQWMHEQYDPNYSQYAMIDNSFGQTTHPMNSLQAMQQQAMQQHAMQQQMMQQQVFQQQALQQQAFQHQMMQQQAYPFPQQQDVYNQQATLMQMAGAGFPAGPMPSYPYPGGDFTPINGMNPGAGSANHGVNWSNTTGRGGRDGRGRGRIKYGGRGR